MGDKCEHNFDYIGGNEWCCKICDEVLDNDDYQEWLSSKQADLIQHLEQRLAEVEEVVKGIKGCYESGQFDDADEMLKVIQDWAFSDEEKTNEV